MRKILLAVDFSESCTNAVEYIRDLVSVQLIRITIVFSIFILMSCQPNVVFEDTLPPGIDSIDKIPDVFQGVYMCESDSSRMYADPFAIYNESYHTFIIPISRVEETENCSIVAGGLYLPGRKDCIPFEYIGEDTIMAKVYSIDTLFSFQANEVMKLYKGRLFMNYKNRHNEWVTHMISPLDDGSVQWDLIDVPDKIKKVEAITHEYTTRQNEDNETMYILKPTMVEFERILQRKYTSTCDILIPINIEI